MDKVSRYILKSTPCPRKSIISALNLAEPHFNPFAKKMCLVVS